MEYMIITEDTVYYTYGSELSMYFRDSEATEKICEVYEDTVSDMVFAGGKLFFINGEQYVCSYDIELKEMQELSNKKAKSFKVYGACIFYTTEKYGMNAMNIDGSNQKRITDAYIWDYEICNDLIFISNDSNIVLQINMASNTYCRISGNESVNRVGVKISDRMIRYNERIRSLSKCQKVGENMMRNLRNARYA